MDAEKEGLGNEGIYCGAAIELRDGTIITGKNSPLMHAASSTLLNAIKVLAALPDEMHLLSPGVIESVRHLKLDLLNGKSPSLDLEETLIRTLSEFGIQSQRHPVHRGVWTGGRKIASLGIRISRWVTSHGFALNVGTDLSFYSLMIPCGIEGCEMTTMAQELGEAPDMTDVKSSVIAHFSRVYGRRVSFEITETILRG